jgi:drug/metabolite transporter (DMT)-like permease
MSSQETQNNEPTKLSTDSDPEEEPKTYINFYFCKLSLNILYTITYVTAAIFLNIVNRLVFYKYQFNKYNFTFMLLQQIFCIVFFYIVSHKSETFKSQAGEITFKDFYVLKHYYFAFATVFMLNTIVIFVGTQMIINASMFQTLRKLVLVKVYFIDLCYGYKKITCFTSICVFMVTIGSILSGVDTFSRDYLGIGLTMISNFINVAYNKFTESFRRRTGVPNLKLLVYNSYISGPVLFILIFATGEFKQLILYFTEQKYLGENGEEGSLYGYFILLFISCSLCIVLNSSFFMSNEKNSSLFTQLLANTKDLLTCVLSRFILAGNKFTFNIVFGLFISTVGAMMFSMKSLCDNMISGSIGKKKEENEENHQDIENNQPAQKVEIKSEADSP